MVALKLSWHSSEKCQLGLDTQTLQHLPLGTDDDKGCVCVHVSICPSMHNAQLTFAEMTRDGNSGLSQAQTGHSKNKSLQVGLKPTQVSEPCSQLDGVYHNHGDWDQNPGTHIKIDATHINGRLIVAVVFPQVPEKYQVQRLISGCTYEPTGPMRSAKEPFLGNSRFDPVIQEVKERDLFSVLPEAGSHFFFSLGIIKFLRKPRLFL